MPTRKRQLFPLTVVLSVAWICGEQPLRAQTSTACVITQNGTARAEIVVPARVMAADVPFSTKAPSAVQSSELNRRRLRESVLDLAVYLKKISGASIPITSPEATPAAEAGHTRLFVGEAAQEKFGATKVKTAARQGWRLVIRPHELGLIGETDESCSYAIYELLERLGCRWYLPGPMGEVFPNQPNITLSTGDVSKAPSTEYRGIWYGEEAFKRRNRQGGFLLQAGHALEHYITKDQREKHPEWRAIINGKPHNVRLKWSLDAVSDAVGDAIIANLEKQYVPSVSLSPDDGAEFDESEDRKLDAGDFDPVIGTPSITDRYVNFANRVANRVNAKFPDVKFGFLAYVQYTRPPVREKLHPNLVPQIAPITFCRAHAFVDKELCPSRAAMKTILEGWAKAAPHLSYYNYMFHLAETSVPYPMMDQMSKELPIIFKNKVTYWQPETMPNFESILPGMWLALRLSWDKDQKPADILNEFFTHFYAEAAAPMRKYWGVFDTAWATNPEHGGCGWGYVKRFPAATLKEARAAMDESLAAANTPMVYRRIKMQDAALRQFERFMGLRWDLNEGRLANLDLRATEWLGTQLGLGREYTPESAFTKVGWTQKTISGTYFMSFYEVTLNSAAKIARENILLSGPLRNWRYKVDEKQEGLAANWQAPDLNDTDWKSTDSGADTWFTLGLENYYGTVWYRQQVKVNAAPAGKKLYLWLAATDGDARVFVNGTPVPFRTANGEVKDFASGYALPLTFDVTEMLRPGQTNQISISTTRPFLNEMGTGGLMGPVYLYREK